MDGPIGDLGSSCTAPEEHQDIYCLGKDKETRNCSTSYNPTCQENIGYGWSKWESWSSCLYSCQQERARSCNAPEQHHNEYCPGKDKEIRNCSFSYNPTCQGNIGYGWSKWGSWSSCLHNCRHERVRSCNAPEEHHDKLDCPGQERETRHCSAGPADPCHQAAVCSECYITFSESSRCDKGRVDGTSWYRFQLGTGENGVIEHCPKRSTCGTWYPIWMNSTHPQHYGVIKEVTMGAHGSSNGRSSCLNWSGKASVTKCVNDGQPFYLYQLWTPTGCDISYCAQKYDL